MIRVKHFALTDGTQALTLFIEGAESVEAFKQLVQNGSGLFPDLSSEMKTLADLVTVGAEMQPYQKLYPDTAPSIPNTNDERNAI